jgi:hypothetical protein
MKSIDNPSMQWQILTPNEHNDWINLRNDGFNEFIPLAPEKKFDGKTNSFFITYSLGIAIAADDILCSFSRKLLEENLSKMCLFYNERLLIPNSIEQKEHFSRTHISWNDKLSNLFKNGVKLSINSDDYAVGLYRPFRVAGCEKMRSINGILWLVNGMLRLAKARLRSANERSKSGTGKTEKQNKEYREVLQPKTMVNRDVENGTNQTERNIYTNSG